ncbi:MAG: hypothetical protein EZS28_024803 [Streblomastix strix]|uniref:Uncharacterized protein n=1 Tax=Streblomastix strix TaxID=222440 RepID=A0A5J4VAP8_9EUKA|nr:MAG: hypothetical protein EZS28_024803 [Streblomastix strix]
MAYSNKRDQMNQVDLTRIWQEAMKKEQYHQEVHPQKWDFLYHDPGASKRRADEQMTQTQPQEETYFSPHFEALKTKTLNSSVFYRTTANKIGEQPVFEPRRTTHDHVKIPWT